MKVATHEIPRNVKGERKNIIYIYTKSINLHSNIWNNRYNILQAY